MLGSDSLSVERFYMQLYTGRYICSHMGLDPADTVRPPTALGQATRKQIEHNNHGYY
jgi:hypothetical protein